MRAIRLRRKDRELELFRNVVRQAGPELVAGMFQLHEYFHADQEWQRSRFFWRRRCLLERRLKRETFVGFLFSIFCAFWLMLAGADFFEIICAAVAVVSLTHLICRARVSRARKAAGEEYFDSLCRALKTSGCNHSDVAEVVREFHGPLEQ